MATEWALLQLLLKLVSGNWSLVLVENYKLSITVCMIAEISLWVIIIRVEDDSASEAVPVGFSPSVLIWAGGDNSSAGILGVIFTWKWLPWLVGDWVDPLLVASKVTLNDYQGRVGNCLLPGLCGHTALCLSITASVSEHLFWEVTLLFPRGILHTYFSQLLKVLLHMYLFLNIACY